VIMFYPLLSFFILLFFGRYLGRAYAPKLSIILNISGFFAAC
jgi:hypothetical protein